jgi:hypothetical protein
MKRSWSESKHELVRGMLSTFRSLRVRSRFLARRRLAWVQGEDRLLQLDLTAIFQMKRGNLGYRYQGQSYTAAELYAKVQRRMRSARPYPEILTLFTFTTVGCFVSCCRWKQ